MDVFEVPNVLAAGLVPLIVGFFWYHPRVFGAPWVRMMCITPEMAERGQGSRMRHTLVSLVAGVAAASVMSLVAAAWGAESIAGTVWLAFLLWLGFMVPTSLGDVLWELKPRTLYLIDSAYWLVSFTAMALVLLI